MKLSLPSWAMFLISIAWGGLQQLLVSVGVPPVAIAAIAAVLQQLGLLGGVELTHEQVEARAKAILEHCQKGL